MVALVLVLQVIVHNLPASWGHLGCSSVRQKHVGLSCEPGRWLPVCTLRSRGHSSAESGLGASELCRLLWSGWVPCPTRVGKAGHMVDSNRRVLLMSHICAGSLLVSSSEKRTR